MKTITASLVEDQTEILLRLVAIEGYMDLPVGTLTRTPTGKTLRWTVAKNLDVLDPWLADHRDKLIVRRIYKDLRRLGMPDDAIDDAIQELLIQGIVRKVSVQKRTSAPNMLLLHALAASLTYYAYRKAIDYRRKNDRFQKPVPESEVTLNFSELVGMPIFQEWAREIIGNWARSSPTKAGYFIEYLEDPDRTATSIAEEFGVSTTIVARAVREGTALLRKSFADGDAPEALYEAAEILEGQAA